MNQPSEAAKELARRLDGVEYGSESDRMAERDKANGLVMVVGAYNETVHFSGAISEECYGEDGGVFHIVDGGLLDTRDYECECNCKCSQDAFDKAASRGRSIEGVWDVDGYSWTFSTDIPHATFDVMDDGEKYCRGIVFDLAEVKQ